jgi:hypothetical protein
MNTVFEDFLKKNTHLQSIEVLRKGDIYFEEVLVADDFLGKCFYLSLGDAATYGIPVIVSNTRKYCEE